MATVPDPAGASNRDPSQAAARALRIVDAMRASVAARGVGGSTFASVAREAGVSRGLLHYHFGTKERLLVEAVRRESELRLQELERSVRTARDVEGVLAALVTILESILAGGASRAVMVYEVLALAQRNREIADQLADVSRRSRAHLAGVLRAEIDTGVLPGEIDVEATAACLLALADGIVVRRLSEPELDVAPVMARAAEAARALLA
jgi:AcrR family transcriptional regulator